MAKIQIGYIFESSTTKTRELDLDLVNEYAERMLAGIKFPSVRCRFDGKKYWLWDGYHRLAAARKANIKELDVMFEGGSLMQAEWDSYSANQSHGLRRTNQQKQEALIKALRHSLSKDLSNRQIADHVGVTKPMVAVWREKLERGELDDSKILTPSECEPFSEIAGESCELEEKNLSVGVRSLPSEPRSVIGKDGKTYKLAPRSKQVPTLDQQLDRALKQIRLILLAMGPSAPTQLLALVADTIPEQLPNIGSITTTIVDEDSQAANNI